MTKKYSDIVGDGGSDIAGQVKAQGERLRSRLATVRHVIAVCSGKGGVGKSLVTTSLAALLTEGGRKVGVLDADINGPSLGKMLGVRNQDVEMTPGGLVPATGPNEMRVMSMDLILPGDDSPVTWDGPKGETYFWRQTLEMGALREFLTDTIWGDLYCLLVDLPPGTDRLPNLTSLVPDLAGVVIVTIPSEVSLLIVKKAITAVRETGAPLIGAVENMAGYLCPHCGEEGTLFGKAGAASADLGVPHLGSVPFDPRLAAAADRGEPFVLAHPDEPVSRALAGISARVKSFLEEE